MKLRFGGLHLQLLGVIILPFSVVLLGIAIAGIRVHQDAMRQLVADRDTRAVRAAAAAISEQLHHREAAIYNLALRLRDGKPPSDVIDEASFITPDFVGGLGVIDRSGQVLISSTIEFSWKDRPLSEVIDNVQRDHAYFSLPYVENGESMLLVAALGDNTIAVGAFSIADLMRSTQLGSLAEPENTISFLTDQSGQLLQSIGDEPQVENLADHPGVQAALRGEMGSSFLPAKDGEHIVAFSAIQPTGWALIIEEPWEAVASPLLNISLAAPLVLIPALVVSLVALWFGASQVVGPIRKLQEQAEQLALAKYDAIGEPVGGIREIQHLQKTLISMANDIHDAQEALQGYIGAITDAQEDERKRLARELHDETIQELIAIDQHIQMIGKNVSHDLELTGKLEELRAAINSSIKELRQLIRALRPIYLEDLGLVPALEMLAKDMEKEQGIPVIFTITGERRRLAANAELAVFRIVQEALTNARRYAQATSVSVDVLFNRDVFSTTISDDGVGFMPPDRVRDLSAQGHFGLMGMHERAELIGGTLDLNSAPGDGTQIRIQIPIARE